MMTIMMTMKVMMLVTTAIMMMLMAVMATSVMTYDSGFRTCGDSDDADVAEKRDPLY